MKLLAARSRQTLICSLVIALTATVISTVHCSAVAESQQPQPQPQPQPQLQPQSQSQSQPALAPQTPPVESKPSDVSGVQAKSSAPEPGATAAAGAAAPSKPEAAKSDVAAKAESTEDASARRGRSEPPPSSVTEKPETAADKQLDDKKSVSPSKPTDSKSSAASKQAASSKSPLTGKTGASSNRKLPANLGTVTSTGSGGPAHYMSKHDAYSAIAEKHGALAQDAMRKSDKRQTHHLQQRFGGIQKASGLGDMMSPFKGVTDGGLARTLGASVRSIMKGKYSVPAYLASAVLGAVALMAFYESPISPLPVPPLPEPPVGRFPPEMPNISPNLQVPFRMNQQSQGQYGQGYQRSFQAVGMGQQQQPQGQQVLFPGATAQQRQMSSSGPVQQFAANLISSVGANKQQAQRKSGLDYDAASSRSFFGLSGLQQQQQQTSASPKLGSPANGQPQKGGAVSSMLNFFGFGASEVSPASGTVGASTPGGHQIAAGGGPISSASGSEQKGQVALSNSHLVNKMKSYFDRPAGNNAWPADQHNHYDQYRRMSIVQALAKDTAFLSSFFTPSRRSSNATSQIQQSISNVLAAATGGNPAATSGQAQGSNVQQAAARMQVDQSSPLLGAYGLRPAQQQQQQQPTVPIVNTKRASSGYGLMRAADRIGHALLETFTSGLLHRNSQAAGGATVGLKSEEQEQQQNALASATSLLTDIMSSYNAQPNAAAQQPGPSEQQVKSHQQQHQATLDAAAKSQQQSSELAHGRSHEQAPSVSVAPEQQQHQHQQHQQQQSAPKPQSQQSGVSSSQAENAAASSASQQVPLVRKTRSIGLEYSMDPMPQPQQPSRATQINNLVDMVSDQYKQNKLLFSFVMNQVGLSHALPYVDQFLGTPNEPKDQHV